jgi:flagellin
LGQIGDNLQRIRELAVQSANTGNNASDRAAMNNEASQLIAEIDRIAANTTYNGIELLDGTFQAQNLQVGAGSDTNDRIAISIGSAASSALGVGLNSNYTIDADTSVTGALAANGLSINAVAVGASSSDGVSYTDDDASGIAIAAAINAVSGTSGVTATVGETSVAGTSPLDYDTAIESGDVLINGVSIGAVAAAGSDVERGGQVAAAVNAISTQTGVTATFDNSTGAVSLLATDGRNITVTSALTSHVTGLASGATSTMAAPSSASTSVADIAAGALTINGVDVGAVNGTYPTVTTTAGGSTQTETASIAFSALAAGTSATVNGLTFTATAAMDATAVGAAFASLTSGMTSTAAAAANTASAALGTYSGTFTSGWSTGSTNTAGTVTATSATATTNVTDIAVNTRFANLVAAINDITDETGVTATLTEAGKISLSSTTGIVLTGNTTTVTGISGTVVTSTTAVTATSRSAVTLSSSGSDGITIGDLDGLSADASGFAVGYTAASTSIGTGVSGIDLTTASSSQDALTTLDLAIDTITDSRAAMGAYQNRLTASIANLETTSMNLSASRSRILDTDYAKETTNLAKSQIIQQAATAMLAQANQSGQSVLALLK